MTWIYLAAAIVSEVVGTVALKVSDGFTHTTAGTVCLVAYGLAFYLLSVIVKTMPIGIVYAIWSGSGIVLITVAGALWFKQVPDAAAIVGILLILSGVVVIHVFSSTAGHG